MFFEFLKFLLISEFCKFVNLRKHCNYENLIIFNKKFQNYENSQKIIKFWNCSSFRCFALLAIPLVLIIVLGYKFISFT